MNSLVAFGMLFWLVLFVLACCWPLVAFLAYRKLAGIERALWALRSELELARRAAPATLPPTAPRKDTGEVPGPRPVSSSMFGR